MILNQVYTSNYIVERFLWLIVFVYICTCIFIFISYKCNYMYNFLLKTNTFSKFFFKFCRNIETKKEKLFQALKYIFYIKIIII